MSNYAIGQKSGYLEILEFTTVYNEKHNRNRTYAICKCDKCGRLDFKILPYNFIKQKSCGCNRKWPKPPSGENSPLYLGYNGISSRYISKAKERSLDRNLEFNLTIQFLWFLYEKQNGCCALSGEPINFGANSRGVGATASIDRIDSDKGYIEENIQWVHVEVNYMKHRLSMDRFIELCEKCVKLKPFKK